ncbi:hypothetical protein Vadar_032503 [Vaccinium darrowii]|uniref:Uncharacterized protein n=1 Tax=Vaccinium darrowii TaxID=229202 RepID=A0ACB7XDS8_9ERIC|nr:hypothetical protein Vadar_032503 [Vaccinium darrowii]
MNTRTRVWTKKSCRFAFVVDKEFSQFDQFDTISNYSDWDNRTYDIRAVLDRTISNISCGEARKSKDYLCSRNTECRYGNAVGMGYNCYYQQGYQGNPYLSHGCRELAKRCLKLNAKKRPNMRELAVDLDSLTRKQTQLSHVLICHENYQSESECSYSFATDGNNEDCSKPGLVFPNHKAK